MLNLPISASTFQRSFLSGDGNLEIATDQDAWKKLFTDNQPFDSSVDRIADVKVSLGTEREFTVGRDDSWKIGISAGVEAGHQIQLIWPDSQVAASIVRGLKPSANDLLVRMVLHGKADASVKASVPVGPLSATFGVAAVGDVGLERLVTYRKDTPAREVLAGLFREMRLPQQVDSVNEIPSAGEVLVSRFGGYLKLTGQLSYGYSMTGSRAVDIGKLNLDLEYKLKVAAGISAAYRLAGDFEIEARAGSSANFARFVVTKSRESEFNFAADFGLDANLHFNGLPDTADEFLSKALGAHAERALSIFAKARQYSDLDELEQAAGKLLKGVIHDLSNKYIGKALTNATLNEFLTKMLSVVEAYNEIDSRIIHLYEDFIGNIPGLTRTLDLLTAVTSRDGLKDISDSQAWSLISRLAGPRLHDILMEQEAFAEFAKLVQNARSFIDDGAKKEIRQLVATFKSAFPLDPLFAQLRGIRTATELKNLGEEKLQGLVEQILGKAFKEIRESKTGEHLRTLHEALDKVETFKKKYYDKLKELANTSFKASLHAGYSRASAGTALLDVEIDLSTEKGRAIAKLACNGDFSEVLAQYNSKIVRVNKGVFTHSISTSTQLQINLFGYGIEGFSRVLQNTEEALEAHEGGLLHVYTTETLIETRKKNGGELTASTFLIASVAKALQPEGSREYLIRTLPKMSVQYDLLKEDNKTKPDEMRQILDFATTSGILTDREAFVRQLLLEFPNGLGKVSARYVVRYDPESVQAAFQIPDNAEHDNTRRIALETMRSFIAARYIGKSSAHWDARFGFAYGDPAIFRSFKDLGFAAFKQSHVHVTLPSWFTKGAPQTPELIDAQKQSLITLYNYQEKFLVRLAALDDTLDSLRQHSSGISSDNLNKQVRKFVEMADDLDDYRENAFFAVFDRLVAEGSGGKAPRKSSLVLEITAPGKETVTKVLTAIRAAPEAQPVENETATAAVAGR